MPLKCRIIRAQDKEHTSIMPFSSPNSMFDHLLESSRRDDFNKWSNIEVGEGKGHYRNGNTLLILSPEYSAF